MEKQTKTINLNTNKETKVENKKLTYEQLNDACNQLFQQNRQLSLKNRELEQFCMNKRLDYLFKVVENSDKFSSDFVVSCTSEIEEAMTIPSTKEEDKEETKEKK